MREVGHNGTNGLHNTNIGMSNIAVRSDVDSDQPSTCKQIKKPWRQRTIKPRRQIKGPEARTSVPTMSLTQIKGFLIGWPWNVYAIKSHMEKSRGKPPLNLSSGHSGAIATSNVADTSTTSTSLLSTPYRLSVSQVRASGPTSVRQVGTQGKVAIAIKALSEQLHYPLLPSMLLVNTYSIVET